MCDSRSKTIAWRVKRIVSGPLVLLAALLIAFEEFAWDELAAIVARLGRLPLLRQAERWIASRRPAIALSLFLLPVLGLLPVKLMAVLLIGRGHALLGLLVILLAKVVGTAIAARLFELTRDQLLQVAWFARSYQAFLRFKAYVFERLAASRYWQAVQALRQQLRNRPPAVWMRLGRRLSRQWQHLRK